MKNTNVSLGIDDQEIQSLKQEIVNQMDDRIANIVRTMPSEYFAQLGDDERLEHFKALVAIKVCDIDQEIVLRKQDGSRVSAISCQNYPGQLARLIKGLPDEHPLVGANIFTSEDQSFIADVFEFRIDSNRSAANPVDVIDRQRSKVIEKVMALTGQSRVAIENFINRYHQSHQILDSPEEIADQYVALKETEHINDIKVIWKVNPKQDGDSSNNVSAKVTVSAASSTTRAVLLRAATYFGKCGLDIRRAVCENVVVRETIDVALLTVDLFYESTGDATDPQRLGRDLETFLRIDDEVVSPLIDGQPTLLDTFGDIELAELFCGLSRLTQHVVNFSNDSKVTRERVIQILLKKLPFVDTVLRHFQSRFSSQFDGQSSVEQQQQFGAFLETIADAKDQLILRSFVELSLKIQRCNFSASRRRGLAFRIPGELFHNPQRGDAPFAVFFVYGCGFDGFHVRFRDVARGGMRLVPTRNHEHYLFESARVFDEAWRLAAAQQLKNKDIAEGGAKAVVVVKPGTEHEKAGRDFVDGLLDLILDPPACSAVDIEAPKYEYLYLGPDENVTNSLINWIVERSSQRGYDFPATIMSSKPESGINHKTYGVTSEGVLIFLRHALLEYGIDPDKDRFSVKLTGGPDGDVGGNAIRILIRDYQDRANIVGVSDGTGSAVDENGLDHQELIRLVDGELGIAHFSKDKLSKSGAVLGLSNEAEVTRRNQLHNEVKSDVFIPAGGRPSTINDSNWQDFLDEKNEPSSRIIVEGANLFLTNEARSNLAAAGVAIVKDSSANKCGVICSSLEIIAGMLLSKDDFVKMKPQYVEEVLELLRDLAGTEALSLFNEHIRQPDLTLPKLSVLTSQQMIRLADVIEESFSRWTEEEQHQADQYIEGFMPRSLVEHFSEPLSSLIPSNYRRHLIAAILSSRIVYREGIQNLATMSQNALEELARSHVLYESKVREMLGQIATVDLPEKELIMKLLKHSGARGQRELRLSKKR